MNIFDDEELSVKICKFGGPLVLFICTPAYVWIIFKVAKKEIAAGTTIPLGTWIELSVIFLIFFIFGLWMCRKGYGWFGGRR